MWEHILAAVLAAILFYGLISKIHANHLEAVKHHKPHDHTDSCGDHK